MNVNGLISLWGQSCCDLVPSQRFHLPPLLPWGHGSSPSVDTGETPQPSPTQGTVYKAPDQCVSELSRPCNNKKPRNCHGSEEIKEGVTARHSVLGQKKIKGKTGETHVKRGVAFAAVFLWFCRWSISCSHRRYWQQGNWEGMYQDFPVLSLWLMWTFRLSEMWLSSEIGNSKPYPPALLSFPALLSCTLRICVHPCWLPEKHLLMEKPRVLEKICLRLQHVSIQFILVQKNIETHVYEQSSESSQKVLWN